MTGKDPLTGQPFTKKVETQKFANKQNQIRFNNRIATERRQTLSPYLTLLYSNRRILNKVIGKKA